MTYLLDTCVLLWALEGNQRKLGPYYDLIADTNNTLLISVVSYWEIIIKQSLGKIEIPDNFIELIDNNGYEWLGLELRHIQMLTQLPLHHNDPFDRLLIAQAKSDNLKLITTDKHIHAYSAKGGNVK